MCVYQCPRTGTYVGISSHHSTQGHNRRVGVGDARMPTRGGATWPRKQRHNALRVGPSRLHHGNAALSLKKTILFSAPGIVPSTGPNMDYPTPVAPNCSRDRRAQPPLNGKVEIRNPNFGGLRGREFWWTQRPYISSDGRRTFPA